MAVSPLHFASFICMTLCDFEFAFNTGDTKEEISSALDWERLLVSSYELACLDAVNCRFCNIFICMMDWELAFNYLLHLLLVHSAASVKIWCKLLKIDFGGLFALQKQR